jgi:hypothetical protein
MADILVGFGDSWAHGDELDRPEENSYLALLGKQLGMPVRNFSTSSASIGHMLIQFREFIDEYYNPVNRYHAVFFVTAKERALIMLPNGEMSHIAPGNFSPKFSSQEHAYYEFYSDQHGEFDANRTIIALQGMCRMYSVTDYWMLGWQTLPLWSQVDRGRFYLDGEWPVTSLFVKDNLHPDILELVNPINRNPYIWPNSGHPNQLGHQAIADAIEPMIKKNLHLI